MDKNILSKIIANIIMKINEINSEINYFKKNISKSSTTEFKEKINNSINTFDSLVKVIESNLIIPDKAVNNIFILINNFLEILTVSCSKNKINDFLDIILRYINLNKKNNISEFKHFIKIKWNYLEKIVIYLMTFIDKFDIEKELKDDIQNYLKKLFEFLNLTYSNLDNIESKYAILPGIISKVIKIMSFKNFKLSSKILINIDDIFRENLEIIFKISEDKKNDQNFIKNFTNFFEFYYVYFLKIKENITKNKFSRITEKLSETILYAIDNLCYFQEVVINIINYSHFTFDEFFKERIEYIVIFLSSTLFEVNLTLYNKLILTHSQFQKLFNCIKDNKPEEDLNEYIHRCYTSFNKKEFENFNNRIPNLFFYTFNYLSLLGSNKLSLILEENNFKNDFSFDDNCINNSYLVLENILEKFFLNSFTTKKNLIFQVVNNYELSVNNIHKSDAIIKCKYLIFETIEEDKEINFNYIEKYITLLFSKFPDVFFLFLNLQIKKLSLIVKKIKNSFYLNDEDDADHINTKETKEKIEEILQTLTTITLTLLFKGNSINDNDKISTKYNKLLSLLKNYNVFLTNFLFEFQDKYSFISQNKLFLFTSLNIMIDWFIFNHNSKLFNKNELNNVLILAMSNYSNRIEIVKYSSIVFLIDFSNEKLKINGITLDLKLFVKDNFDFIINSTINKIIYLDSKNDISNDKITSLNLFNSLILFLKDSNDVNLSNFYYGELNNFTKKILIYIEYFLKEKNFSSLECLLEIIVQITNFQNETIEKHFESFKVKTNFEDSEFPQFVKENLGINDSNLFRNIILRILPILGSNKISLMYKSLKIFKNLTFAMYWLPLDREEKTNFSTEDAANISVKSSLGPIMHESWEYFIYILNIKENKYSKSFSLTLNIAILIIKIFVKVLSLYPKFFNSSRLFDQLIPALNGVFKNFFVHFDFIQIRPLLSQTIYFLEEVNNKNNIKNCSEINLENLLVFYETVRLNYPKENISNDDLEKLHKIIKYYTTLLSKPI